VTDGTLVPVGVGKKTWTKLYFRNTTPIVW
jgi:hypothetical protein